MDITTHDESIVRQAFVSHRSTPGAAEQRSTRVLFFIGGFAAAAWAPLIPFVKVRLGINDGTLGMLLLCFGLGSLATMPFAGWLASRFGCRSVLRAFSVLTCLTLPLLALVGTLPMFIPILLLFGASIGAIDVVVNIQAVIVEKAADRPLMSGFHAGWSIGGFAGAGLATALFAFGLLPWSVMLVAVALIFLLLAAFSQALLPYGNTETEHTRFVMPHGLVIGVGVLSFIAFLAEGSVLDWGAVFLSSNKQLAMNYAGAGYTVFSIVMVICRLTGDRMVQRLGGANVLLFGGLLGAGGFAMIVLAPVVWLSFLGFGMIGCGMSNVVPVLYSLLGKQHSMPVNQAVSVVSTVAYSGVLLGPAIIGFIANVVSLEAGLLLVAIMLLAIAASARLAR